MFIVIGTVVQNVVAEAMSTEVVSRRDAAGNTRPEDDVRAELSMVQVIGRLALSAGMLAVAGLSSWLASVLDRETVFLWGLVVPALSVIGVLLIKSETNERRPLDWRILGGGLAFGVAILGLALGSVPFAQELIFALSMAVICTMLFVVTREFDAKTRRAILFTSIIIFAFRSTPLVGDGYFWWTLDLLKFDEAFYGTMRQTAAILAIVAMWLFSKQLTEYSVTTILFWLAVAGAALSLPNIGLFYGLHHWTEPIFGFGARTLALVDAATASPFARDLVRPDGIADEHGANRGSVADQVSQSDLCRWARQLCGAWSALDCRRGAWAFHPSGGHCAVRATRLRHPTRLNARMHTYD
jgi:hypothetical protein